MRVAPVAYALWQRVLRFDPDEPGWPNRNRFVLSEGHASPLLWSLLPLSRVRAVGMHTFGASAPLKQLVTRFGFTPDRIADVARRCAVAAAAEMPR